MFIQRLLKKYPKVIISHRNNGFGDNLIAAANAWYYAKHTHRALAIVWQPSRYLENKRLNAFSHFFRVPEEIDGVPVVTEQSVDSVSLYIISRPHYYVPFPDPLLLAYRLCSRVLNSSDGLFKQRIKKKQDKIDSIIENLEDLENRALVTHGCYSPHDYLKPFFDSIELAPDIKKVVEEFAEENFKDKKVIGVHIRYYSPNLGFSNHRAYWQDQIKALSSCIDMIKKAAAGLKESDYVVFLSTDGPVVQEFLSQSLDNVVFYEKEFGTDSSKELHEELPVETAESSLIEMFLLAKSDILVRYPPGSWFSYYASLYVKEIIV